MRLPPALVLIAALSAQCACGRSFAQAQAAKPPRPRLLPAGLRVRAIDLNMTRGGGSGGRRGGEHLDALVMVEALSIFVF